MSQYLEVGITVQAKAYQDYIKEHIDNVHKIWKYIGNDKQLKLNAYYWTVIDELIQQHDESKYSSLEFNGYKAHFYPEDYEKEHKEYNKIKFDVAWNAHQKTNPHHWQYWILIEGDNDFKILPMHYEYVIEMLCDWSAMSLKFKDIPSDFYAKNKGRMILHKETRKIIEHDILIFDQIVRNILD